MSSSQASVGADRAGKALLSSQALLSILESSPLAQLILLPDRPGFTMAAASDAYLRATGSRREELIGRGVFEVFPDNPKDKRANGVAKVRASLEEVLATKAPSSLPLQRYDLERPESQGGGFEERYWSTINTPVVGPDGNVQFVIHSIEDVTEKFLAQLKAQGSIHELRLIQQRSGSDSEQRLLRAQRAGRVGSFDWMIKENRAICTPELEALYGLEPGALSGGIDSWKEWVEHTDAERVVGEFERCIASRQSECAYEFRVIFP